MLQLQLLKPFALRVEIYPTNFPLDLVETDVIETLKACTRYSANAVIRHEEMFLPAHEYMFSLRSITDQDRTLPGLFLKGAEGAELSPVVQINLTVRSPVVMLSKETVLGPDDLALEVGCECWVILS